MVGSFIHSDKRHAEIGLPFSILKRQNDSLRRIERKREIENSIETCRLSQDDEFLLYGTRSEPAQVAADAPGRESEVKIKSPILVNGIPWTEDEVRQMKRIRASVPEGRFLSFRRMMELAKTSLSEFGVEVDHACASRFIASCS